MKAIVKNMWLAGLLCLCVLSAPAATHYLVPTNSAAANPYTNWSMAATSIVDVVKAAMTNSSSPRIILVTNGIYTLTNSVTAITNNVVILSVNGRDATIFNGNGLYRCFHLQHTNCILDGLTISNGYTSDTYAGGGIRITGGTVTNCLITDCVNTNSGNQQGGGISVYGIGIIANSVIRNNLAIFSEGGGISLRGTGTVVNCIVENNRSISPWEPYGGGIQIGYTDRVLGTVKNCLIRYNSTTSGGGLFLGSGCSNDVLIANCTVVSNAGGGIRAQSANMPTNALIFNCVVVSNTGDNIYGGGTNFVVYSCSTWQSNQWSVAFILINGNTTNDPKFTSFTDGNYRFNRYSPCFNSGTNQMGWMNGAVDLDGHARILHSRVDMGAYELLIPEGTMFRGR